MRPRSILSGYLLRSFLPVFLGAMAFFVLILELFDLFANLWRYLSLDVPLAAVARVSLLYAPACVSLALPVALLFAISYAFGSLYSSNELVVVFGSGISLASFAAPLLALSVLLSAGWFFFDDAVALPALRQKTALSRGLLRQASSLSNADVAVIARDGRVVYRAEYYDDANSTISGLTIVERDGEGSPLARIEAPVARWQGEAWVLTRSRRFVREGEAWVEYAAGAGGGAGGAGAAGSAGAGPWDEPPSSFRNRNRELREMDSRELSETVAFLRRAGLPSAEAVAERHKRFAFSLTPFVVALLSTALGGRFRKNVLLMSLLASLLAATGYYVVQMISMLLAKTGAVPPAAGAWTPFVAFALAGVLLFRRART